MKDEDKKKEQLINELIQLRQRNAELEALEAERKRTEAKLMKSENLLKEAQHIAHIGSWERDLEKGTNYWSEELYCVLGYKPEEVEPTYELFFSHVHSEDKQIILNVHREYHAPTPVVEIEYRIISKDGAVRFVLAQTKFDYDNSENAIRIHGTLQDITDRKQAELEKEKLITELKETLSKVKTLSGLLPICASCKKIRDDKGYWNQIEAYIRDHSEVDFSHSICPECKKKLYPGLHGEQ